MSWNAGAGRPDHGGAGRTSGPTEAFDAAVATRLGVNRTDGACLDLLDQLRRPASAGELAAALRLTSGSTTTMIDRLVAAPATRRGSPTRPIGGGWWSRLTPAARTKIGEIFGPSPRRAEVFRPYSAAQLDLSARSLTAATAAVDRPDRSARHGDSVGSAP